MATTMAQTASRRRQAPVEAEEPASGHLGEGASCLGPAQGGQPGGGPVDDLGMGAAQAHGQHRAEVAVSVHPDQEFEAGRDHGLDQDAIDRRIRSPGRHRGQQLAVAVLHL